MSNELLKHAFHMNRRTFLSRASIGIGSLALGSLLVPDLLSGKKEEEQLPLGVSHFAPKAKRVIFLHMAGAPSQLELFDYKPELQKLNGQACPQSLLEGKRFAFIKGVPKMLGHRQSSNSMGNPEPGYLSICRISPK